jgi:hypothetical protein
MKTPRLLVLGGVFAALATTPMWSAAANPSKITSDLLPHVKRQETVDKAARLTRPPTAAPVPELPQPFNPPGFDAPDADDPRAPVTPGQRPTPGVATAPAGPTSDRDLLEAMAPRIQPTGMVTLGGNPLLIFPGAKRVRVNDVITVTFNDREYDITITAIDRTNFTLRYRGEELTRPIKPTK